MDLNRLQDLKQKLLHDQDLAPVWSFFLDHFGGNPAFIALGERAHFWKRCLPRSAGNCSLGMEP